MFWTVVQPPLLVAFRVQRLRSPRFTKMIHEFQMLIFFCGRSFNFGDAASSKATSLSRLPVRSDALGDFGVPVHMFTDQPEPTPLMLVIDFLKEHRCVVNTGEELIQFPLQSECWWLLFMSSRGLFSMQLCGQHWEPSSQTE